MEHVMVRYTVKADRVEEIVDAVRELVGHIRSGEPGTMSYEAFQVEGSSSFVHVMTFRDPEAEEFHRVAPHVIKFVDVLNQNCEAGPEFTRLGMVRSSRF